MGIEGTPLRPGTLDDAFDAVRRVEARLTRTLDALRDAGVRHALAGGNAVAEWVRAAPDGNERGTPNVDVVIPGEQFELARAALERAGFAFRPGRPLNDFTDDPDARFWQRRTVHLLRAGEPFGNGPPLPTLTDLATPSGRPTIALASLVYNKLDAWRPIDRVHLDDLIDAGLFGESWVDRLDPERATKLRHLLDTFVGSLHGAPRGQDSTGGHASFEPSLAQRERSQPGEPNGVERLTVNILRIMTLTLLGGTRIHVTFSDGTRGTADLAPLLRGPVFDALRDPSAFATARLDATCGTIVWPNGADLAPEAVRDAVASLIHSPSR